MTGRLYGVGVGPGDPGLVTLRALEVLRSCDVIAYPVKEPGEDSTALEIVRPVLDLEGRDVREFVFSMSPDDRDWEDGHNEAIERLCQILEEGKSVAMVTLGDVGVYSTFMYVKQAVESRGNEVILVPGIPSFCHGAAKAGLPLTLGDEGLAVVPMAKGNIGQLSSAMDNFGNIVVMKAFRSMPEIADLMSSKGIPLSAATVISNVGMPDEYVGPMDLGRTYGYFTTILIKRNQEEKE